MRHPEASRYCSQSEWLLYGRKLCRSGGTGKAEAAKLPGAGIGPKQCPGKCAAEKGQLPDSVAKSHRKQCTRDKSTEPPEVTRSSHAGGMEPVDRINDPRWATKLLCEQGGQEYTLCKPTNGPRKPSHSEEP
jgi:hypothetical protein